EDVKKVLLGGPMMGAAIPSLEIPIVKVTNAVLALSAKDADPQEPSACIKCGRCVRMCPMRMMPPFIEAAYTMGKPELLQEYKVGLCAECGCCAYSCPAKRPLVQVMTLSKKMLRNYTDAQRAASAARAASTASAANAAGSANTP
ncbi:MAG: 4Fe-4S dicluster domain-containing protein, partial [Clostridiales bacterium]|nr:4Fe-4S dicluster domain-containing protein [Clostridiales bacterium]